MNRFRRVVCFALPAVVAVGAFSCLAGGAYARGQATTWTVNVAVTGPGTISGPGISCRETGGSCVASFTEGTSITLTATSDSGASFAGWYGDCVGASSTCTMTMTTTKAVGAAFNPGGGGSNPTLTISVTGNGTVTGTGINCGNGASDCSEAYAPGTAVTLTETPASGATFSGWGGTCSGTTTTCTVTMQNASLGVSATFSGGSSATTLTVSATGNGTVVGVGINCGSGATDCSETFAAGTTVTLVEVPNAGATFSGWGGSCTGTAATCVVQMTTSKTVTAIFSTAVTTQSTLTVAVTGSGRVTGPGINCGLGNTDCSEIYTTNTTVTLAETPASGATFAGWGGNCSGATASCTVVMTGSKAVTATFSQGSTQKILTVTVGGSGRVSGTGISCGTSTHDCSSAYDNGTAVTLLATPAAGAVFLGWGGACSGTQRTCNLVMDAPKAVSASFSTPGANTGGTFSAHSLGNPIVVRNSVGWGVTLRFFTSRSAAALLRLSLNGRLVSAFTFSPHAGTVIVGPFNVARAGLYRFRLTLSDNRGATAELIWNVCLGSCGGTFRPAVFVTGQSATAVRTATGWIVSVRFRASTAGGGTIRMTRAGQIVSSGNIVFHSGAVVVRLPARQAGLHRIVLTARNAAGRTVQVTWNVLL